jgi:hypothetical protein
MRRITGVFSIALFLCIPECVCGSEYIENAQFSPDSQKASCILIQRYRWPPLPNGAVVAEAAHFCLCGEKRSGRVLIDKIGASVTGGLANGRVVSRFSPDSRHAVVMSPNKLVCVDIDSLKSQRLSNAQETLYGFTWVSNNEVCYVSSKSPMKEIDSNDVDRTFWKQKITDGPASRKSVFKDDEKMDSGHSWAFNKMTPCEGKYVWSPRGHYVILKPTSISPWGLLDLSSGKLVTFGESGRHISALASWKPDETEVVYATSDPFTAFLLEITTGKTFDLSDHLGPILLSLPPASVDPLQDPLRRGIHSNIPAIDPLWTSDGSYIVLEKGYLVQPRPWRCLSIADQPEDSPAGKAVLHPPLHRLSVPGWLLAMGVEQRQQRYFGVTYDLQRVVPIEDVHSSGGAPIWNDEGNVKTLVSPDGRFGMDRPTDGNECKLIPLTTPLAPIGSVSK